MTVAEYSAIEDLLMEKTEQGTTVGGDIFIECSICSRTFYGNEDLQEVLNHLNDHKEVF